MRRQLPLERQCSSPQEEGVRGCVIATEEHKREYQAWSGSRGEKRVGGVLTLVSKEKKGKAG